MSNLFGTGVRIQFTVEAKIIDILSSSEVDDVASSHSKSFVKKLLILSEKELR